MMDWDLGDVDKFAVFNGARKSANTYLINENANRLLRKGVPVVVSFPRSGRHWLMLALECYFKESISYDDSPWSNNELPSKILFMHEDPDPRQFPQLDNYLCLYRRDIISCVFSHMWKAQIFAYHDGRNEEEIQTLRCQRSDDAFLKEHLDFVASWVGDFHPKFSSRQVADVITFEDMKNDLGSVINKVCLFLKEDYVPESVLRVEKECNKEVISDLTEPFQVNTTGHYGELRLSFRENYSDFIRDYFKRKDPGLLSVFDFIGDN